MKSFKHYILIIAISILPFITIFANPLAPHTHDINAHLPRIAAYYKALTHGQIFPRWAADLNYGYGMPLFNFIYHVPYLVSASVIALGGGLVFSYSISMFVSFLLSGVFMLLFTRRFFKDDTRAMIVTVLFQFAPFHLIDLVVRGDAAEGYAIAFLPLVLYFIVVGFENSDFWKNTIFTGVATTFLIISHNAVSLVFFGVSLLFLLIFAPNNAKRLRACAGLLFGLSLSAFYWMPALMERKFTYGDLFMKDLYSSHFSALWMILLPNITNARSLQIHDIAVSFGLMHAFALGAGIVMIFRNKFRGAFERRIFWFSSILTLATIYMMLPVSKILWEQISLLRMFQFPWRFLSITIFSLSLLGGITLYTNKTSKIIAVSIIILTVLSSAIYFRPPLGFDQKNENEFWNYPLNTTFFGETDVIWSAGPRIAYPKNRFEVFDGRGVVTDAVKQDTKHTFTVIADSNVGVVDHTQYFPGWRVFDNGKKLPIEFQDQNWRGLITFRLPPGTHHIQVLWGESPIRQIADNITILSLIGIAGSLLIPKRIKFTT